MDRSRRSFPTAAGWFRARSRCRLACQNAADDAGPHAEEAAKPPSRSMRAHPSSSFETRARAFEVCRTSSTRALLRMRTSIASFTAHDVKQPISFSRRVGVRGLRLLLRSPRMRVGGAPRNVRVQRHPSGVHITRHARRLARRLASHDAGRSPLGAPPWRFWASGPRFRLLGRPPSYNGRQLPSGSVQRAPRSQVVVPGGRGPGPPGANGYKPPPQDATPRSAFRMSPETPLDEQGWEAL